jgi:hypothetical protein
MADSDGRPSGIAGYLGQLFAYLDAPWKVLAVIALMAVGGMGWIVYQHQDEILESWLTPNEVALKTHDIPIALDKLAEEKIADVIQVWAIDFPSNTQKFVAARRSDGERPVIPSPRSLPIIVHVSDAKALVDVLNGSPVCVNLSSTGSPLARRLAERGMKRGCAIPIPPNAEAFVGVIYLAWMTPPEHSAEDVAVRAAREIAKDLSTR